MGFLTVEGEKRRQTLNILGGQARPAPNSPDTRAIDF